MKSIRLAIRYPADLVHPIHQFVCDSPVVDREILLEGKVVDGTRTLLFYVEGERSAYEQAMTRRLDVDAYDITAESEAGFYLYVRGPNREAEAEVFAAFNRETVVIASPIEFRSDGTMHLTLVGPPADIQSALDDLPPEFEVDVKRIGTYGGLSGGGLTERQRAALDTAWRCGYYDVPREGSIDEVAAELDCAISTASTLLRRAERELVADVLDPDW